MPIRVAPRKLRVRQYTKAVGNAAQKYGLVSGATHAPPGRKISPATSAPMTDAGMYDSHRITGRGSSMRDTTAMGMKRTAKFASAIPITMLQM